MAVRKLTHLDKARIIANLSKLQGEDRRLRFGISCNDQYIADYVTKSFEQESQWFGVDHIDGHLVATCHVAIYNGEAELGCCVDEEYRGEGFAQEMFNRAVTWLRVRGITHVFMHCLTENGAMKHIARKNDMVLVSEYGETEAAVDVEPATPATYMEEAYMNRIALYDMYWKNNMRVLDFYWNRTTK
jgi:RimJ/RimL family protein N-acetyltransferase